MNNINPVPIRRRFIEHDYLFKKIRTENPYITVEDIVLIPSEHEGNLVDVTFVFTPKSSGFITRIIDNISDTEISIDDLTPFALDYYYQQVRELSIMQQKNRKMYNDRLAIKYIGRIKEMLSKTEDQKAII